MVGLDSWKSGMLEKEDESKTIERTLQASLHDQSQSEYYMSSGTRQIVMYQGFSRS